MVRMARPTGQHGRTVERDYMGRLLSRRRCRKCRGPLKGSSCWGSGLMEPWTLEVNGEDDIWLCATCSKALAAAIRTWLRRRTVRRVPKATPERRRRS